MGLKLRAPRWEDQEALGALILDAFRGTTDYEGEDLAASVDEIRRYFEGRHGGPLIPRASVVAWRGQEPVGACLVARWVAKERPFVASVFTAAGVKRAGVARLLVAVSVRRLSQLGYGEVLAVITRGNTASERLFTSLGFEVFERYEPKA